VQLSQSLAYSELNVRPNEMRLSCGAEWTISQMEDYHSKTAPPASGAC